jgi:hypothetical protein
MDRSFTTQGLRPGKPINLRPGRTTVVKLPSGEEVVLWSVQHKGRLLLRITAPEGSEIDHQRSDKKQLHADRASSIVG